MVEPSQSFNEDIRPFVPEFVSSGSEEVERLVEVKVKMPVEMSSDKLVDFVLRNGVKVLELVESRKLFDIESIWRDHVWNSLEQMLRLQTCDF